jgi:hypothetical protein
MAKAQAIMRALRALLREGAGPGLKKTAPQSIGGVAGPRAPVSVREPFAKTETALTSPGRYAEARGMTPTHMGKPDGRKFEGVDIGDDDLGLSDSLRRILDDPSTRALSDDISNASIFERGPTALSYLHKGGRTNIFDLETDAAFRGKGSARQAMEEFLRGQDASGRATYLTAAPTDSLTNQGGLDRFYSSLGFKPVDDVEGFALRRGPAKKDSSDLLAAVPVTVGAGLAVASGQKKKKKRKGYADPISVLN